MPSIELHCPRLLPDYGDAPCEAEMDVAFQMLDAPYAATRWEPAGGGECEAIDDIPTQCPDGHVFTEAEATTLEAEMKEGMYSYDWSAEYEAPERDYYEDR